MARRPRWVIDSGSTATFTATWPAATAVRSPPPAHPRGCFPSHLPDRVTLQVSLDSADSELHDAHRGPRSHAQTLTGIALARDLGFTVRIAATLHEDEIATATSLQTLLDSLDIDPADRLIRPVAQQGYAEHGQQVSIDTLAPEPTVTLDGLWWHPVAVTDPAMRVADHPLPLAPALDIIRDTLAIQDAAHREGRRHVFRCA